jgi:hypothetical protein
MLSSLRALRELAGRHRDEYDIESPQPSHRHSCPAAVERPAEASRRTLSRSSSFRKRNSQPQATRSRSPFSRAGSTRSQSRSPFSRSGSRPGSRPGSGSSSASLSASANRPCSAAHSSQSSGDESDEHTAGQLPGLFEAEGLYSFEAESAAELAFSVGQRLRIFPDVPCEPGWWLAELHGRQGLVPCAYVRSRQASRPQSRLCPNPYPPPLNHRPSTQHPSSTPLHPQHHPHHPHPAPTLHRRATHTSRWVGHAPTPIPTHTAAPRAPPPPPAR